MKTIETTVYSFGELSEAAKQKAIDKHYDINIDYDWWEFTYDDAENIGIKITGFDLGRGQSISLQLVSYADNIANDILKNHGEVCDTYKAAQEYLKEENLTKVKFALLGEAYEDEANEESASNEHDFKHQLEQCYWKMLRDEYEYLTSSEAIAETLEANDYDFEEDGTIF